MKAAILALTLFATIGNAYAGVDPCTDPKTVVPNNWLVSLNNDDDASREDLLESIDAFSEGGFSIGGIFAYDSSISHAKTFVLIFDPSYWSAPGKAEEIKEATLTKLMAIPSNKINCNGRVFPSPAIGVGN